MPHPLVGQPPAAPLADPRAAGTARRTVACHWLHLGPEEPFGASLTWSALVGNRWLFNTVGVFLRRCGNFAGNWAAYEAGLTLLDVMRAGDAYFAREWETQCALLRDIFVPDRLPNFDPTWRTPQALALACTAYEKRRFEDMPVLADALEEAGCRDADILAHCRSEGPHVRGCWVVDLLLGKE